MKPMFTAEELAELAAFDAEVDASDATPEELAEVKARNDETLRETGKYGKGYYARQYYAKNKERIKAYQKAYYASHKEYFAKKHAEYYALHRDEILEQQREYAAANKERILAYHRARYLKKKLDRKVGRDSPYTRKLIEEGKIK